MRFLRSAAGTVFLWLLGTVLLAATALPWVYRGGKYLAAKTRNEDFPSLLEWLGKHAGSAELDRFFSRTLLVSALVLLPCMVFRLRRLKKSEIQFPATTKVVVTWKWRIAQLLTGLVLAAGILWLLGVVLENLGAYNTVTAHLKASTLLNKAILPAIGAPLVEEFLFRGLLLGVWLRIAKPITACLIVSLLFACLHFMSPPPWAHIGDPTSSTAGFHLLGAIVENFTNPRFIVTELATLFTIGLILAYTRIRTGALWFPIGLHAGWILAFAVFKLLHGNADSPLRPLWIGPDLRSGLAPLLALALTAVACKFALKYVTPRQAPGPSATKVEPQATL